MLAHCLPRAPGHPLPRDPCLRLPSHPSMALTRRIPVDCVCFKTEKEKKTEEPPAHPYTFSAKRFS